MSGKKGKSRPSGPGGNATTAGGGSTTVSSTVAADSTAVESRLRYVGGTGYLFALLGSARRGTNDLYFCVYVCCTMFFLHILLLCLVFSLHFFVYSVFFFYLFNVLYLRCFRVYVCCF